MAGKHRIPWPGMGLAFLTLLALLAVGFTVRLALAVGSVWVVSLWLEWLRPTPTRPPAPPPERPDIEGIARGAMRAAIEPLGLPVVLIDGHRILAANEAARIALGAHIIGQDARVALRHPDAVKLLDQPEGTSTTISGLTGTGSAWQLTRRRIDSRLWLVELVDRTSQADIGRAHTDFVANASHELRTPLASIIGYVETLADDPSGMDQETTSRFLGIVLREARRMQSLVADLMSLSQLEAEKHDVPTERIELGMLAAQVAGEFTGAGSPTDGRLDLVRPEGEIAVAGDRKQLEQLLRNLIDNAFKYGDSAQSVQVELKLAGRGARMQAQLAVTDYGQGIAPDHIPHLTRRFYRTDPGRSRAAGGTGLGLAIVKHIVERHRGRLDIASKLGKGTVVTVRLPLARQAQPPERNDSDAEPALS